MTTSISNASAEAPARDRRPVAHTVAATPESGAHAEPGQTLAGSFVFLALCLAIVLTTLAYGTVHYWSLAIFQASAAFIVVLWTVDAWRTGVLRISRNQLQWPLVGLFVLGVIQLLPLGSASHAGTLPVAPAKSLSLDPYSTRFVLIQLLALIIYFAAALVFTDSPRRLRALVRTIIIFGFFLAIFGLVQSFTSPTKIYWFRELPQSVAFGPFINRHHFAGYMELTLALPLGLLFSGAVESDKRLLYIFAIVLMGVALIMTASRGGIISLIAELFFLVTVMGARKKHATHGSTEKSGRMRAAAMRAGLAFAFVIALFLGVLMFGGEDSLSRFVGTVNADDPTTGRAHFWSVTLDVIRDYPLVGAGLGAYSLAYTRYDSHNGLFRVEQAHNDYLQVLSDAGVVGALLGLFFIVTLFRLGFERRETADLFRRGVATGALAGCFAVLVHSFFDFTLHTTSNALLFLILAALATLNGRVEHAEQRRRRRRRHHSHSNPLPSTSPHEQSYRSLRLPARDR